MVFLEIITPAPARAPLVSSVDYGSQTQVYKFSADSVLNTSTNSAMTES